MKFARYLEETQVPEWKRAYIDYRGLKKRITAIRKAKENLDFSPASPVLDAHDIVTHPSLDGDLQPSLDELASEIHLEEDPHPHSPPPPDVLPIERVQTPPTAALRGRPQAAYRASASSSRGGASSSSRSPHIQIDSPLPQHSRSSVHVAANSHEGTDPHSEQPRSTVLNMGVFPRLRRRSTARTLGSLRKNTHGHWELAREIQWDLNKSVSLMQLIPLLSPVQMAFFDKLDAELDKVEVFYVEREKEMKSRTAALKAQLNELRDHRRQYHEAQSNQHHSWLHVPFIRSKPDTLESSQPSQSQARKRQKFRADDGIASPNASGSQSEANKTVEEEVENVEGGESSGSDTVADKETRVVVSNANEDGGAAAKTLGQKVKENLPSHIGLGRALRHDPDEYYQAKKKLKKAALECYRGLEILNNYRTLNLIGFRKALKKFEKVAKIPAQQAYTVEKIEPNAFVSGATVDGMLHELELLYADRFTHGDKKRAMTRLRGGMQRNTHHFSTFRSGMLMGLAIPAFVYALYLSFQEDTREAIPGWDGLLFVYSILLVPALFAFLVGLNLQVWASSRINYVFIFEFDLRTKMDHRQYYEMPAFLLATLCYAFWLSFARIGSNSVSPTVWPLLWLILAAAFMLNPLPAFYKPSRWWLVKNVSRLLTSGTHRVEFTDFWMGDQFCSLVFTLSNLFFIACAYGGGFESNWRQCASKNKNWGVPFVLASLPLIVRAVQSVKRWVDSRLITHLINGGKYTAGILNYLFFYNWRHQGSGRGGSFAVWCMFATIYSLYAGSWDLLMDWSLLRPHATYPLLRPELLYTSHIPLYYFAIITNILIRFIWVIYIPETGPDFLLRAFIAGILEALRRWQWNFFRLENEHIGNMDQYRVTREVPLPYTFDEVGNDSDDDDDARSHRSHRSASSLPWRRAQKARATGGECDSSDQT